MANVKISQLPASGAITGTEQIELNQGGVSVRSTVDGIKNGGVKVYRAKLNLDGGGNPVATVLENNFGAAIVWSHINLGTYIATLNAAFPANKSFTLVDLNGFQSMTANAMIVSSLTRISDNQMVLRTYNLGTTSFTDSGIQDSSVEILVYP